MISNSEFEKLWVLYKTEGEPKGVSILMKTEIARKHGQFRVFGGK